MPRLGRMSEPVGIPWRGDVDGGRKKVKRRGV